MTASREGKVAYRGIRFDVHALTLPGRDGGTFRRDVVAMADAVVVLPLLDEETVVMIRNERIAAGRTLWELCAGTLEEGEEPRLCAERELIEETGYRAGHMEALTAFYTCPGICTEYMYAYLARDLTHVGQDLDENEMIDVHVMKLTEVMRMIRNGDIQDAKTIATLLFYDRFIKGEGKGQT